MSENNLEQPAAENSGFSWGKVLAWGFVLVLMGFVALQLNTSQKGNVGPGEPAPYFELQTFDGEVYTSDTLQGKVIVMNFWASWCKPCEQEAADLQTAWEIYQERGDVIFLGVDYTDTESEALKYLAKFNITYPNGPDLRTRISQDFRMSGVPETYIINKEGLLVYVKIGPFLTLQEITSAVDAALAE